MTELSQLITRLEKGVRNNASYIRTIRHPELLVSSLKELNDLIGNDKVKDSVATQVSHLIMMKRRAMEDSRVKEDDVMLNTVLYSSPGGGKTLLGTKLAKIWYSLGYLDGSKNSRERKQELGDLLKDLFKDGNPISTSGSGSTEDTAMIIYVIFVFLVILITLLSVTWSFYNKFGGIWTLVAAGLIFAIVVIVGFYISNMFSSSSKSSNKNNIVIDTETKQKQETVIPSDDQFIKIVTRADFVDKYVGWSDKKTVALLRENLGKVLFVDEAYSLATDAHDTFGIEALTALNLFLSQHPREIIVIFAGYKDLMENGIFSFQPGLKRRFMWHFECGNYTDEQLFDIFKLQLDKKGWGLAEEETTKKIFKENASAFTAFGGDTERLAFFSGLEHSRDFIKNDTNIEINKLKTSHVAKGIEKLKDNNIENGSNESTNPLANLMKMMKGNSKGDDNSSLLNEMKNKFTEQAFH